MTITPHGYPDYSKELVRADTLFINDPGRSSAVTVSYPTFFCGNTEALRVHLDGNSGSGELQLFFHNDAAGTSTVGVIRLGVGVGQDLYKTVIPVGAYCHAQVVIGPSSPFNYNLLIHSTQAGAWSNDILNRTILTENIVVPIGAGATSTFHFTNSYIGEAFFSANVNQATSWGCSIQSWDNSGTHHYVLRIGITTNAYSNRIFLPGGDLVGEIFNLDVAARNYDFVVIANPTGQ